MLDDLTITPGAPYPFGITPVTDGMNFAVFAKDAEKLFLSFFDENDRSTPLREIELDPELNKTGDVWHIHIAGLPSFLLYNYRLILTDSQSDSHLLLDPYAKVVVSHSTWRDNNNSPYQPFGVIGQTPFDWQGDKPLKIPPKDLIIYEMHVRGFTKDASSGVEHPGTYLGMIEKIPYLTELGVNAVELLPIHEFNETETMHFNPKTKEKLCNYWGYSTANFFSPMSRYATVAARDQAVIEFKTMVREFHKAGIAVILDVVYNHTGEGNELGPIFSFKGFDTPTYYMLDEQGEYFNFSGTGNTFNTNHPIVLELILNSLRYWVVEMHVDGFRFDLASIFNRAQNGAPIEKAPLVQAISHDSILSKTTLIAEAWDAAGLYQVGGFYPGTRWSEWNGKYRDIIRGFIKGDHDLKTAFATALCGSQDLYGWGRAPFCSVNFITAHDGFTLADLVTYNDKHNEENGEDNRDGLNNNISWNCGIEGHSCNKRIVYLRERQIRNFFLALMLSQGIPMILMGDEYAHSRHGNNNTWCQDNDLNWFLWDKLDVRPGFYRYYRALIHFRKAHPLLRKGKFLSDADITWHGTTPLKPDWDHNNHFIAFTLNDEKKSPVLYAAFNASHQPQSVTIPPAGKGKRWFWVVNTHNPPPNDYYEETEMPRLDIHLYRIHSNSAILLEAKPESFSPPVPPVFKR